MTMNTEKDKKPISQQKCSRAFTIFCGVCEYDEKSLKALREGNTGGFQPWKFHINDRNLPEEEILRGFNTIYYESFISSIFPDYSRTEKKYFNEAYASHTLRLTKPLNKEYDLTLRQKGEEVVKKVRVDYLDLFLFPGNIAFYCFKCDFSGYNYDDITLLEGHIRDNATSELSFIRESLSILKTVAHEQWLIFGNKLKSFTIVEMGQELDIMEERNLLYDLATSSPVVSAEFWR